MKNQPGNTTGTADLPGSVEKAPEPPVPLPKPKGRPKGSYKFGPLKAKTIRLPQGFWESAFAIGRGNITRGIREAVSREALRRRLTTEALQKIDAERPDLERAK